MFHNHHLVNDHVELPGAGSIHVPLGKSVAGIVKSPVFPLDVSYKQKEHGVGAQWFPYEKGESFELTASLKKWGRDALKAASEKFNAVPT